MLKYHLNVINCFLFQLIFVDLKPDPVKILSIATVVRSPTDSENGPWFYVDARKTPPFIEVSWYSYSFT